MLTYEEEMAELDAGNQSLAGDGSVIQLELESSQMHLGKRMWLLDPETQAASGPLYLPSLVTCHS